MLILLGVTACQSATAPNEECKDLNALTNAPPSTPPTFSGVVRKLHWADGIAPGGPVQQCEVWVAVAPSVIANTGVVVGRLTAVFVRTADGALLPGTAADIHVQDWIEVWPNGGPAYGSAQAPPNAPAYFAAEVIVHH